MKPTFYFFYSCLYSNSINQSCSSDCQCNRTSGLACALGICTKIATTTGKTTTTSTTATRTTATSTITTSTTTTIITTKTAPTTTTTATTTTTNTSIKITTTTSTTILITTTTLPTTTTTTSNSIIITTTNAPTKTIKTTTTTTTTTTIINTTTTTKSTPTTTTNSQITTITITPTISSSQPITLLTKNKKAFASATLSILSITTETTDTITKVNYSLANATTPTTKITITTITIIIPIMIRPTITTSITTTTTTITTSFIMTTTQTNTSTTITSTTTDSLMTTITIKFTINSFPPLFIKDNTTFTTATLSTSSIITTTTITTTSSINSISQINKISTAPKLSTLSIITITVASSSALRLNTGDITTATEIISTSPIIAEALTTTTTIATNLSYLSIKNRITGATATLATAIQITTISTTSEVQTTTTIVTTTATEKILPTTVTVKLTTVGITILNKPLLLTSTRSTEIEESYSLEYGFIKASSINETTKLISLKTITNTIALESENSFTNLVNPDLMNLAVNNKKTISTQEMTIVQINSTLKNLKTLYTTSEQDFSKITTTSELDLSKTTVWKKLEENLKIYSTAKAQGLSLVGANDFDANKTFSLQSPTVKIAFEASADKGDNDFISSTIKNGVVANHTNNFYPALERFIDNSTTTYRQKTTITTIETPFLEVNNLLKQEKLVFVRLMEARNDSLLGETITNQISAQSTTDYDTGIEKTSSSSIKNSYNNSNNRTVPHINKFIDIKPSIQSTEFARSVGKLLRTGLLQHKVSYKTIKITIKKLNNLFSTIKYNKLQKIERKLINFKIGSSVKF